MFFCIRYQSFIENFNISIALLDQVCWIRIGVRDFLFKALLLYRAEFGILLVEFYQAWMIL